MSAPPENIEKLEQLRKRSEQDRKEKAYAARLEALEEHRAAKSGSGGTFLIVGLVVLLLIVGAAYMFANAPEKVESNLILDDAAKISVVERLKQHSAVLDMKIIQKKSLPKDLKLVIYVDSAHSIRSGRQVGNEVISLLMASAGGHGVGSTHYDYIIVLAQGDKQLTLGRMENGARSITWK